MKDIATSTEVIIKPMNSARSSEPYHEWKAPRKGDPDEVAPNECYIEAVDGERFQIERVLHPLFSFDNAPEVQIVCSVDGDTARIAEIVRDPSERDVSRQALRASFDSYHSTVDGVTKKCGFSFSQLSIADDNDVLSKEDEEMQLGRLGKIEVTIQRGSTDSKPGTIWDIISEPRKDSVLLKETNKVVAIDGGRSHAMRPLDLGLQPIQTINKLPVFTPIDSASGEKITFTFYYTTSEYLEIKQIKPIINHPNTLGNVIDADDFPNTAAQPLPDHSPPVGAVSRIKREGSATDEQAVKRTKNVIHRPNTLANAIDVDDHSVEMRASDYLETTGRFIKEEDIKREKGASDKTIVQAELKLARADLREAELELEMVAGEPAHQTRDARRRTIMAEKVVARFELQLAKLGNAE